MKYLVGFVIIFVAGGWVIFITKLLYDVFKLEKELPKWRKRR